MQIRCDVTRPSQGAALDMVGRSAPPTSIPLSDAAVNVKEQQNQALLDDLIRSVTVMSLSILEHVHERTGGHGYVQTCDNNTKKLRTSYRRWC